VPAARPASKRSVACGWAGSSKPGTQASVQALPSTLRIGPAGGAGAAPTCGGVTSAAGGGGSGGGFGEPQAPHSAAKARAGSKLRIMARRQAVEGDRAV